MDNTTIGENRLLSRKAQQHFFKPLNLSGLFYINNNKKFDLNVNICYN